MRRHFFLLSLLLMLTFALPCARCENVLLPELSDPVDQKIQQLAIMYQRDDPFFGVPYNKDYLNGRGCQPISMANGLIAAFGLTDYDTAAALTLEAAVALVPPEQRKNGPVHSAMLPVVLSRDTYESSDRFPVLKDAVCSYPGTIAGTEKTLGADEAIALINQQIAPSIVTFCMSVNPSWEDAVRVIFSLYDAGMSDATLILTRAGASKESYGTPFASGKNGHYISALIHVGKFMQDGSVYILDSLPRALPGEPSEDGGIYRARYPFGEQNEGNHFNRHYEAARINPCVIRLTLREEMQQALYSDTTADQLALRTDYMKSFTLYGACSALVVLPEAD